MGATGASKVFRVTNRGTANLTLGKVTIPAGYQLVNGLLTTLAPGKSDTFTIKLLTKKAGKYTGQVSFKTNVVGKTPFHFSISGTVLVSKARPKVVADFDLPVLGSGRSMAGVFAV